MKEEQKGDTMSRMGDFAIDCAELYLRKHPEASWEDAMDVVMYNDKESKKLQRTVLRRKEHRK